MLEDKWKGITWAEKRILTRCFLAARNPATVQRPVCFAPFRYLSLLALPFASSKFVAFTSIARISSSVRLKNQLPSAETHPGIFGHIVAASRRPASLLRLSSASSFSSADSSASVSLSTSRVRFQSDGGWLRFVLHLPSGEATSGIALRAMAGRSRGGC
jgi:hypothetical protein